MDSRPRTVCSIVVMAFWATSVMMGCAGSGLLHPDSPCETVRIDYERYPAPRTGKGLGHIFPRVRGVEAAFYYDFSDSINWNKDTTVHKVEEPQCLYQETREFSLHLLGIVSADDSQKVTITVRPNLLTEVSLKPQAIRRLRPHIRQLIDSLRKEYRALYQGPYTFIRTVYQAADYTMSISSESFRHFAIGVPLNMDSLTAIAKRLLDSSGTLGLSLKVHKIDSVTYRVDPTQVLSIGYKTEPVNKHSNWFLDLDLAAGSVNRGSLEPTVTAVGIGLASPALPLGALKPRLALGYESASYQNGRLQSIYLEGRLPAVEWQDFGLVSRLGYTWADVDDLAERRRPNGYEVGIGLGGSVPLFGEFSLIIESLFSWCRSQGVRRDGLPGDDVAFRQLVLMTGLRHPLF